jgi:hypothetical protein
MKVNVFPVTYGGRKPCFATIAVFAIELFNNQPGY